MILSNRKPFGQYAHSANLCVQKWDLLRRYGGRRWGDFLPYFRIIRMKDTDITEKLAVLK